MPNHALESIAVPLPGPPPVVMSVVDTGERIDTSVTLLCIHGVGGTKEQWQPQIEFFSPHHRVVVPDLRGHGATPAIGGAYTMEQIISDLQQLIAVRQLTPPLALLSHSYGGVLALELARRRPELVSHVVLIGVARHLNYGLLFKLAVKAPVPDFLLEYGRRLLFAQRLRAPVSVMRSMMKQALLPWRGWDHLHEIKQPVLALAGKDDVVVSPSEVSQVVSHLADAQMLIVPGARHKIHLQQAQLTNEAIRQFLMETKLNEVAM
jgi:3-oxoadipate enol-lactonase